MKLFVRNKEAIETAIFSSLQSFRFKYREFESTHDLEQIYHNIRFDAMRKARSSKSNDLKMYVEQAGLEEETIHGKNVEQNKQTNIKHKSKFADEIGYDLADEKGDTTAITVIKDKVVVETKIVSKTNNNDIDLRSEIVKLHAKGFGTPAKIVKQLKSLFNKEFDLKEVRKLHYKILGK